MAIRVCTFIYSELKDLALKCNSIGITFQNRTKLIYEQVTSEQFIEISNVHLHYNSTGICSIKKNRDYNKKYLKFL